MSVTGVFSVAEEKKEADSAIIYCDGGYQQQYRTGGWGIHGYTYVKEPPKKGTGNPKAVPTSDGYKNDDTKGDPVTIEKYIDGFGGVPDALSNNHTELLAMNKALNWVSENNIKEVKIYSDSQYVVRGLDGWVDKWRKNGWLNSQGAPVSSKELWEQTDAVMNNVKLTAKLDIKWIKGHAGHVGNEMADRAATTGNILGRKGLTEEEIETSDPSGYWGKRPEVCPLLCGSRWYFQTTDEDYKTERGEYIYYHGDHGSDDTMHGKPITEASHSVVFLKQPEPGLEVLRQIAIEADVNKRGSVMIGNFMNIFNPTAYSMILSKKAKAIDMPEGRFDMKTITKQELLREQRPAWLSLLAVDEVTTLQRRLEKYLAMDETKGRIDFVLTDITDLIYDRADVKGAVKVTLKNGITQSLKSIDVDVRYTTKVTKDITGQDDPDIQTRKVKLILDCDLPKRNALAKLASVETKVKVLTWRMSDESFRFATVVESEHGVGIWAGVYSNLQLV